MHIPDGFIDLPTAGAGLAVAAGAIAFSLRRAKGELDEATAPLAGLTAVFVFAAQMINFPVGAGTSGHLIGGALAAILIGPWAAVLALSVVVALQALLFADGGLTALGLNLLNLAVIAPLVGWLVWRLARRAKGKIWIASFLAGFVSVIAAALGFVAEYAMGGTVEVSLAGIAAAMVGIHALIGVGEGVITALVVASVASTRPDLVYGLRPARPQANAQRRATVVA